MVIAKIHGSRDTLTLRQEVLLSHFSYIRVSGNYPFSPLEWTRSEHNHVFTTEIDT